LRNTRYRYSLAIHPDAGRRKLSSAAGSFLNAFLNHVGAENPRDPGSLRTGSLNARLAAAAAYELAQADAEVTRISLGDFPLPIYDGDLQTKSGVPKNAINLKRMIGAHHGVLIVTPEYNSSVPPLVKNTIDWVTRVQDAPEARAGVSRTRRLRSRRRREAGSAEAGLWRRCG